MKSFQRHRDNNATAFPMHWHGSSLPAKCVGGRSDPRTGKISNPGTTKSEQKTTSMKLKRMSSLTRTAFVGGALLGGVSVALSQGAPTMTMDQLEKENQDLKARMESLEALVKKEGVQSSSANQPKFVSTMSDISISGFA